ncbi:MAG: M48 family metallopeptidase [Armatimonadota bacterium]
MRIIRWLRRQFLLVAFGALLVFCAVLLAGSAAAKPAEAPRPAAQVEGMPSGEPLTPQEIALGHQRAARARAIELGSLFFNAALLVGVFAFGGSRWLAGLVARIGRHWLLGLLAVVGIVGAASSLLTLPLDYYSGFVFPHQYGLSNQTTAAWLRDHFVGAGVGTLLGLPVAALIYALLRWQPRTWWAWVTAVSVPLSLFFMLVGPVFVAPLFNKFTPLQDQALRREILAMAHAQGVPANDVFQVDASRQSNAVNAYVNGIGPTQRIVLYDTLLKWFTHEEIKHVMAHEIGHYVLKHIPLGIALSVVGTFLSSLALYGIAGFILRRWGGSLGFHSLGHPASYPLLLALGLGISLVAMPFGAAASRAMEWQADEFASRIDHNHQAGIAVYYKLARLNIADMDPPRWTQVMFGTHPTIRERIAYLKELERRESK